MLNHEQIETLEQAIMLLFRLRNDQSEERHEIERDRRLGERILKESNGAEKSTELLLKEIQQMILSLNVKGSVRIRTNGLIEFRSRAFGSVYGRNEEDLKNKLQNLIKRYPAKKLSAVREKKRCPTFSEFYTENYFPYKCNQGRAARTLKRIVYNYEFVKKHFDKPLNAYNAQNIEAFLYSIPQTRKRQIMQGFLNNLFKRAVAVGVLKSNPSENVEKMQHTQIEGRAFSFVEQEKFFNALFEYSKFTQPLKDYYLFVYLSGCRRNEAIDARRKHVYFEEKYMHVAGTKTGESSRNIPLFPLLEKLLGVATVQTDGSYFPYSEAYVDNRLRELLKKLDINHKLHDLRHTFGTLQIYCCDVDVKTASLWLGHSNVETTLRTYTHPEQLDMGTFLRGDISMAEKCAILKQKYAKVYKIIEDYILKRTQIVPKN